MYDAHHDFTLSKSMGQIPYSYNAQAHHPTSPSPSSNASRERVSISNLIYAVDNTQITTATSPSQPSLMRLPARNRKVGARSRAISAHGSRGPANRAESDEAAALRRKIQSEKKRLWRKNLSPDQKAKRQELDAQRKREQRMNMTPDQRAEARRKDAARKAAKRRIQKEKLREVDAQTATPVNGLPTSRSGSGSASSNRLSAGFNRSTINDLLNWLWSAVVFKLRLLWSPYNVLHQLLLLHVPVRFYLIPKR